MSSSSDRKKIAAPVNSSSNSRGKLCTNSCPVADLWMNCAELYGQVNGWLCKEVSGRDEDSGRAKI